MAAIGDTNMGLAQGLSSKTRSIHQHFLSSLQDQKILLRPGDTGFASAPSNIALLKYWGKVQGKLQVPANPSLSLTLPLLRSETQVELVRGVLPFDPIPGDSPLVEFKLNQSPAKANETLKLNHFLESLFEGISFKPQFKVHSLNQFPTGCGIASSASGWAALVGALADTMGLAQIWPQDHLQLWISEWARLGSGSASRSSLLGLIDTQEEQGSQTPSAFVSWTYQAGENRNAWEPAHPQFQAWSHVVLVVDPHPKTTSSSQGHQSAWSSPFFELRLSQMTERYLNLKKALLEGDFNLARYFTEKDAWDMHTVMATSAPPILYPTATTFAYLSHLEQERMQRQWQLMWTLDAGPNIHVLGNATHLEEFLLWLKAQFRFVEKQPDASPSSKDTSEPYYLRGRVERLNKTRDQSTRCFPTGDLILGKQ
jgi:diphosphomevalonate decarboxylase